MPNLYCIFKGDPNTVKAKLPPNTKLYFDRDTKLFWKLNDKGEWIPLPDVDEIVDKEYRNLCHE